MVSDVSQKEMLGETADDLVQLLRSAMFEQFMELYRSTASRMMDGAVVLATVVNERIKRDMPTSEVSVVVSQQINNDKHLVVIQDASRFFGENTTVTRQMFLC